MEVLLIYPPWGTGYFPAAGVGTLKSLLSEQGISCRVLYANLLFKRRFLFNLYEKVLNHQAFYYGLWGEALFSKSAFPDSPFIFDTYFTACEKRLAHLSRSIQLCDSIQREDLEILYASIPDYLNELASIIETENPRIVGISAVCQQLVPAIATARLVKTLSPDITTMLGGFQCAAPMGEAVHGAASCVDIVVSGEADLDFPLLCRDILEGRKPERRIHVCSPVGSLESIPPPDYSDYFAQLSEYAILHRESNLIYETARMCPWGNCSFCGDSHKNGTYRRKSPEKIDSEVGSLFETYKATRFAFSDYSLPESLPTPLIKKWRDEQLPAAFFFETRVHIPFKKLALFRKGGLQHCQGGVETLDDRLLGIMRKGACTLDNLRFLRDCRTLGIQAEWHFMTGLPGEKEEDYSRILQIAPALYHLPPPSNCYPFIPVRYSPIVSYPKEFGVKGLKPMSLYSGIFPQDFDIRKGAAIFEASYPLPFAESPLKESFFRMLATWQSGRGKTLLGAVRLNKKALLLIDNRSGELSFKIAGKKHRRLLSAARKKQPIMTIYQLALSQDALEELKELIRNRWFIQYNEKILSLVQEPYLYKKPENLASGPHLMELEKDLNSNSGLFARLRESPEEVLKAYGVKEGSGEAIKAQFTQLGL